VRLFYFARRLADPAKGVERAGHGVMPFIDQGALVFGGGHVVLPLLRQTFVASGGVSENAFLAGYGAAQAVPSLSSRLLPTSAPSSRRRRTDFLFSG
jgi:hypothetical protein